MSVYFMASIRIKNEREYERYLEHSEEIFKRFKGAYLAVDNKPGVLEGKWNYNRVVLIRFDTSEDFNAWYQSEDYQEILRHRLFAAECDSILIQGN